MKKTVAGVPVWLIAVVALGAGVWWYRSKQKATAAQTAATAATAQQASTTAAGYSSTDPILVAYQAGEASGVSSYSAGVSSGIGLVESIMGSFATVQPTGAAGGTTATTGGGSSTVGTTGGSGGTSAGVGFGQTTVGGQPYDILGITNAPGGALGPSSYQVSGGAPVYYEYPGTNTASQGVAAQQGSPAGTYVLTPSIYGSYIYQ